MLFWCAKVPETPPSLCPWMWVRRGREVPRSFRGRACDKLLQHQLRPFLRELDKRGMLFADRDRGFQKCGFFCIRKERDDQRNVWILRLALDRRPRNSVERHVRLRDDAFPQGTCFVDAVLEDDEQLRLWTSDLPSLY